MSDPLDLASFILMMYASGIALYVARKAMRISLPLVILSLLLATMILFHGMHHLMGFLGYQILEEEFELASATSALALALVYAYVWRSH
ncbi:MAG TPA: hypothetical protein VJZ75_01415 [Candidatus Bathyarchaeia archaeon]|nr:hypothetical protein [Candidatus Bathyarchaeia archaeon]